jgi:hypothetical protein
MKKNLSLEDDTCYLYRKFHALVVLKVYYYVHKNIPEPYIHTYIYKHVYVCTYICKHMHMHHSWSC